MPEQIFRTEDITPEYMEVINDIMTMIKDRLSGPMAGASALVTALYTLNKLYGESTDEEFAELIKRNLLNIKIVPKGASH